MIGLEITGKQQKDLKFWPAYDIIRKQHKMYNKVSGGISMQGVAFKEVGKLSQYGYRIVVEWRKERQEEVCTIFEKRDTNQERKILEISSFNKMGKLRLQFENPEEKAILVDWISIQPKNAPKGIILFYQEDGFTLGKEFIA